MSAMIPYIRMVCEGQETEPNYLNGYLRSKGYTSAEPARKAKDHSPKGVAKEAIQLFKEAIANKIPKKNIFIWAVFDRDGHHGVSEAIEMLRKTPIQVVFSNVCFEFWILLHFEYTTRPFRNCDEIIKHIQQKHDADYAKANDHFDRLRQRIPIANQNAARLMKHWEYEERPEWTLNPYTNAHLMMDLLETLL